MSNLCFAVGSSCNAFPQGAWGGVQCILKGTCWSDHHFYRRAKKSVEQRYKITLHHLTKLQAFTLQMHYQSLRNATMHFRTFNMCWTMHNKCTGLYKYSHIKGHGICNTILPFSFYSSAVVTCTSQAPLFFKFIIHCQNGNKNNCNQWKFYSSLFIKLTEINKLF